MNKLRFPAGTEASFRPLFMPTSLAKLGGTPLMTLTAPGMGDGGPGASGAGEHARGLAKSHGFLPFSHKCAFVGGNVSSGEHVTPHRSLATKVSPSDAKCRKRRPAARAKSPGNSEETGSLARTRCVRSARSVPVI